VSKNDVNAQVFVGPLARMSPKRFAMMRDLAGLTLNQLAKRIDVDYTSLSRYEAGFKILAPEQMTRAVRVLRKAIQRRAAAWQAVLAEEETRSPQSSTLAQSSV